MKIHVNIWKDILQKKLFILWKKNWKNFHIAHYINDRLSNTESVKGKKDEVALKDEDVPVFLEKKVKST